MTNERGVHPDCRNASNPYHECSEYCFQIIAEAKARMEQRGPALVQAGGRISQSSSGAQEQDEDLHDDRQDSDDHADGDRECGECRCHKSHWEKEEIVGVEKYDGE
ncbi:hypothetical protein CFP56_023177 [Quercus suber]|uniref:Uncharacterized protein n=1 Tax=Quercus suber TaxID=58331 RepID=A0AAW0M169_QUESU